VMREKMECDCPSGHQCMFVDLAISDLLLEILPSCETVGADSVFQPGAIELASLVATMGPSMHTAHFKFNNFDGQKIPAEIGNVVNFKVLHLNSNNLTGAIPESIGNLTQLKHLHLSGNTLTSIPASISKLTKLEHLYLNDNSLSGVIPESISALVNLRNLGLQGNNFNGSIPASISNLTKLL